MRNRLAHGAREIPASLTRAERDLHFFHTVVIPQGTQGVQHFEGQTRALCPTPVRISHVLENKSLAQQVLDFHLAAPAV